MPRRRILNKARNITKPASDPYCMCLRRTPAFRIKYKKCIPCTNFLSMSNGSTTLEQKNLYILQICAILDQNSQLQVRCQTTSYLAVTSRTRWEYFELPSLNGRTAVTFKLLNVFNAENPTEIGKNVDGSAAGTENSMEPLRLD